MEPWATDLIKDSTGVILGWALGLASALLVDWRRERTKVESIKIAITRELREVAHRLLILVYKGGAQRGDLDRPLLEWMVPQIERYAGPNPKEDFLKGISALLKRSDSDIAEWAALEKSRTPTQFRPREDATYTSAAMAQAHDLDADYAVRVLDVLSHLRMFNEAREDGLYYNRLSFAPGLTEENYRRAIRNAESADAQVCKRARIIVEKITELEAKVP